MIRTHHHQPSLWTGVLAEEVDDLWEPAEDALLKAPLKAALDAKLAPKGE